MKLNIIFILITVFINLSVGQDPLSQRPKKLHPKDNDQIHKLSRNILLNSTYTDVVFGNVKLENGYCSFSASKSSDDFRVLVTDIFWGDLDNDGQEDAVVVLASYEGGNRPSDLTLCAVLNENGKPTEVAHIKLNEVGVDSIGVRVGMITVFGKIYDENDAYCCPTKADTLDIIFENNTLRYVE